jgi:hypothetical protein
VNAGDLMLRKKEIIATTATRGWYFINEQADAVLKRMIDAAIDCDQKEDSEKLVTEARAARKFWKQLQQTLEASKQVEVEGAGDSSDDSADGWYEVAAE